MHQTKLNEETLSKFIIEKNFESVFREDHQKNQVFSHYSTTYNGVDIDLITGFYGGFFAHVTVLFGAGELVTKYNFPTRYFVEQLEEDFQKAEKVRYDAETGRGYLEEE